MQPTRAISHAPRRTVCSRDPGAPSGCEITTRDGRHGRAGCGAGAPVGDAATVTSRVAGQQPRESQSCSRSSPTTGPDRPMGGCPPPPGTHSWGRRTETGNETGRPAAPRGRSTGSRSGTGSAALQSRTHVRPRPQPSPASTSWRCRASARVSPCSASGEAGRSDQGPEPADPRHRHRYDVAGEALAASTGQPRHARRRKLTNAWPPINARRRWRRLGDTHTVPASSTPGHVRLAWIRAGGSSGSRSRCLPA